MTQFAKGESGNNKGRPVGTKGASSLMKEALNDYGKKHNINTSQAIIDNIVAQALEGNLSASKMIMDRLSPTLKPMAMPVTLPERMPKNLFKKGERILSLVAAGDISPDIGHELLSSITMLLKAKESSELEERLKALEGLQEHQ